MFFDDWQGLLRTLLAGAIAYVYLLVLVRVSGKRTLSKLNAFDLIVTVALGSTLATVVLSKDVALAEGALALGVLIGGQYLVAWLSVRSRGFSRLVKSRPALLYYRGTFRDDELARERVVRSEVLQAIRQQGHTSLAEVEAVVLESDGTLAVLTRLTGEDEPSALEDVDRGRALSA